MTAIVGVKCKDGVVIGSDSSATFVAGAQRTIEQPTEKIYVISGRVIVAGTGMVGLGQRFCALVSKAWADKVFQGDPIEVGKKLCAKAIGDFGETQAPKGQYGALVAFPCGQQPYLCEFDLATFQPELKDQRIWYVSMGSAQPITDPFLALMREVFWRDGVPTVQEAAFAVTWALDHAIQVNPGGVNGPIRMAILERGRNSSQLEARVLSEDELGEHRQNVDAAKAHLREFRSLHHPALSGDAPNIPAPSLS